MTRIKNKTLTVLIVAAVLILCFVLTMVMGQSNGAASAATLDNATDVQKAIDGFMANGKAPATRNTNGTSISSVEQLKNFLISGTGRGYLTQNINNFSWDGAFTNQSTSTSWTELDGNGYTVTFNTTSFGSSPARTKSELDDNEAIRYTYAGTKNTSNDIDVYGGLIGYLRSGQTIRNCNFVFGNYITANESGGNSISTANSGTLGLIAGFSLGTIDNCSVTMKGSLNMEIFSSNGGALGSGSSKETMSRHSFAAGIFVGTMSNSAVISNSKLIHNGTMLFKRSGYMSGGTGWNNGYVRVWVGGIVGWMANGSQVYNVTTEGNGALTADYGSGQHQRTFAGIVAGCAGADTAAGEDSLAGYIQSLGVINGVINNWEGIAKYSLAASGITYSPTGSNQNSIQYLAVGLAGRSDKPDCNVFNIFMNKDVYKGNVYSIGFDYSSTPKHGSYSGRRYSTNIVTKDVLGQEDGSTEHAPASSEHISLIFAGTSISAPVWAVYDIKNANGILWSKKIINDTLGTESMEYYYDKVTSIEEAKKYDLTYTEIPRNDEQNLTIEYSHGKAVYFTKSYPEGSTTEANSNNVYLPSARYGEGLEAPKLELYYDSAHTQAITTLTDKSYWMSMGDSNNVLVRMTECDRAVPDTYRSFLYIESPVGRDYSYIQFVNETFRYVSYIYDDPIYQEYKSKHPNYEPVSNGNKLTDWQQRIVQEILPKIAEVDWDNAVVDKDITKTYGDKQNSEGYITSYGTYKTTYDGEPVTFNLNLTGLLSGDTCGINYEYRVLDSHNNTYSAVDSCVNVGTYKLVVTSLTNSNYEVAGVGIVDYCIDFTIEQREIGIINRLDDVQEEGKDTYAIKVPYAARDIALGNEIAIYPDKTTADNSKDNIVFYNILAKDKDILKYDYAAYGEGDLDMRNIGKFEMTISLLGGINSGNYKLPARTKYIVEIVEADVVLGTQTYFSYPYGYLIKDQVDRYVTIQGVENDDVALRFNQKTYKKKVDGVFVDIEEQPFDAGTYQITYAFTNELNPNYKSASITVDVVINPRNVKASFADGSLTPFRLTYGSPLGTIGISFNRQTGENGIFSYEYPLAIPVIKFEKCDAQGNPTGVLVDMAEDVGTYLINVGLDFQIVSSEGWQTNENTKYNYNVTYDDRLVIISKKDVNITIKDYSRAYGDELPEFIGEAYAVDDIRAWSYASSDDLFFPADNIVVMPRLSTLDQFANAGKDYTVSIDYMSDKAHLDDPTLGTFNKIDNYNVIITNENQQANYTIAPREVKVKVYLNTNSVIYGDDLPLYTEAVVTSSNNFFEQDGIVLVPKWHDADGNDVVVGSPVGKYMVSVFMDEALGDVIKNYHIDCEYAEFDIAPKTLTIIAATVEGEREFTFDGEVHKPTVIPVFAEDIDQAEANTIDFNFNYFEIVDGEMATEKTENPWYAGEYRVFIADVSNPNYTVVFGEDYVRGNVIMTINKRNVKIDVLPAYRVYSVEGSLTPIMRGEIHEESGWHYYTKEEAEEIYGEDFYRPYSYASDTEHEFIQNEEELQATMYIDEYYKELGVKRGVVKLVFGGLVPDAKALDEDGNWITETVTGVNGEEIQIIKPAYRNYNIEMNFGDLHVLGADLEDVERYVSLRSYEQEYNGQDRFDDFRVLTSNDNIANALKFRIFQYVAISSLSKTDADALAKADDGHKYTQAEVDGKYVYTEDDANGTYVRKYFRRTEYGDSVSDSIVNAGQYFVKITPADEGANIFTGKSDTISFIINKAERKVSASDILVSVNYNKIALSSKIEGMEVSFNGAGYVNRNTFVDLTPNTQYEVKVRFAATANYLQSAEIVLNLHTGIDISAIQSTLSKYDKIDFSNIEEYESKVLAFINDVSQEDMSLIDQAKFAKLQASYEQLIRGANSVVSGAQKAGATAVGQSGKTTSMAAKGIALSMSGISVMFAGLMFFARKKKEDAEQEVEVKTRKSISAKRVSKMLILVVVIALVSVMIFAGCTPSDNGEFTKADLYKIASYQADDQIRGNRDLTIEVKSSDYTLYKYADGKETIDKRLDVEAIHFYTVEGIGFEFDDLYFANAQFAIEENIATFNADIKESLVFLGVSNAINGKVSVEVDAEQRRLNSIDVSYDVVSSGITYNVTIGVKVSY